MASWNKGKGEAYSFLVAHKDHADDDCLLWPFSRRSNRYGAFGHLGKIYYAHRFMCELAHGPSPGPGFHAAHSCGVQPCVNPRHLSWKTQAENEYDKKVQGSKVGGNGNRTRLPREIIASIRAQKGAVSQEVLARKLGVPYATIRYWQRTTHEPFPPGKHPESIRRREKRAAQMAHRAC